MQMAHDVDTRKIRHQVDCYIRIFKDLNNLLRWCKKFENNTNKMATRWEKCGWYEGMDGDSRTRRDTVERGIDTQERINYENPEQGIR